MSEVNEGQTNIVKDFEVDASVLRSDWQAVGGYLLLALHEVANDLGGKELAKKIGDIAVSGDILPNPEALKTLEEIQEGTAKRVFARSSEIQRAAHQRDLAEISKRKDNSKKYGRNVIKSYAIFKIFGPNSRA